MDIRLIKRTQTSEIDSEAWDLLAEKSITPNPFYERWSLLPALKYLDLETDVYVATIYENGKLVGLFPVCLKPGIFHSNYLTIWQFHDCYLTDPLFSQEWVPSDIFNNISSQLNAHIVISPTHTINGFGSETPNNSYRLCRSRGAITEFIGWELYSSRMPSKLRSENKRVMSRMLGHADVVYVSAEKELCSKWLPTFLNIERSSWKGREGRAIKQNDQRLKYFNEAVKLGEQSNKIKFQALQKGKEVLAISFRYITNNQLYEIKTTYDDQYSKLYPGIVLELLNVQDMLNSDFILADSCATAHNSVVNRIWPDQTYIFRTVLFRNSILGRAAKITYKAKRLLMKYSSRIKEYAQ